jgi:hypothetical protein
MGNGQKAAFVNGKPVPASSIIQPPAGAAATEEKKRKELIEATAEQARLQERVDKGYGDDADSSWWPFAATPKEKLNKVNAQLQTLQPQKATPAPSSQPAKSQAPTISAAEASKMLGRTVTPGTILKDGKGNSIMVQ